MRNAPLAVTIRRVPSSVDRARKLVSRTIRPRGALAVAGHIIAWLLVMPGVRAESVSDEEIREAIVLGFRGIEELAVTAGRKETRGTYDPESLRRAEACLETALDKVRLAKALFGAY